MPGDVYRRLHTLLDILIVGYEEEKAECEIRLAHYPKEIAGVEYLQGRLDTITEHIEKLKIKKGEYERPKH